MSNVFANIETGDTKYEGVLAGFQQMDEDAEKFIVFLVESLGVFPPEFALMHGGPFQTTGFHLNKHVSLE